MNRTIGDPYPTSLIDNFNSQVILPEYIRGYVCKSCGERPQIIIKKPDAVFDPLQMTGAVGIKCKCFGSHCNVRQHQFDEKTLLVAVRNVWDNYTNGIKNFEELAGPAPEGRDTKTHHAIIREFLKP